MVLPQEPFSLFFSRRQWILAPAFAQQPSAKPAPPDATVPGFTVTVTYSQKAMDKLVAGKETVIVVGYLYGFPMQGTPKKDVDEHWSN